MDSIGNLPRGGICAYCQRKDNDCLELIESIDCDQFLRKDVYSDKKYNGAPEPILNSHGYEYIEVDESGEHLHLKQFGDFKCIRCEHINYVPQVKGKLTEPYECESDVCGRKGQFKRMFPLEIMNPAWKTPTGIIPTESTVIYDALVSFLEESIYFEESLNYSIMALWIMASWVSETFNSCPYLMFIAPKDSGKTRALDLLTELSYRPLPAVSFSSASIFRSIELWNGTLLIDEAEYQLNPKSEKGQDLYGILNGGYKKGMFAIRTETIGDTMIPATYNIYGFKAIAATRPFNPTLESRSIVLHMIQHEVKNIILPQEVCEDLRNRLLYFRFSNLKKIKLIFPQEIKKGRIVEIFYPLYSIAAIVDPSLISKLDAYIQTTHLEGKAEDKVSLPEADIIRAMQESFDNINNITQVSYLKDLLEFVKYDFPDVNSQQVGYIIKAMGFTRKKDRHGMYVDLANEENKKKFDMYKERFDV